MKPKTIERFRILVADDEEGYINLFHHILCSNGVNHNDPDDVGNGDSSYFSASHGDRSRFDVISCRQGDIAVDLVRQSIDNNQPFSVAFLDIFMPPGPDGITVAKQIREIDPFIEIAIVTGRTEYNPDDIANLVPPIHKLIYIQKPFRIREIYHFAYVLSAKRHQEQTLLTINKKLEEIIAERTCELRGVNERLLSEIDQRTRAEAKLQGLYSNLVTAQEEERKRIASDLHDDLGQTLAVLKLRIQSIKKKISPQPKRLHEECDETLSYINQIIEQVRRLSYDLSPAALDDLGLTEALKSLVRELARHAHIKSEMEMENIDDIFPATAQVILYRVFQEALTNIEKHSEAKAVKISVRKEASRILFTIEDTGKGFDVTIQEEKLPYETGFGLSSINERIKILGGDLRLNSRPGAGTKIEFAIPFQLP